MKIHIITILFSILLSFLVAKYSISQDFYATDSLKSILENSSGIEKANSMLLGVLAGADTFGHCGICGTDHAGSLLWLAFDNELMNYTKRIARGFEVNAETLATDIVKLVGPAGNFLAEPHTVEHFRREFWLPSQLWTRESFDGWQSQGCSSFAERLTEHVNSILTSHNPQPLDDALSREIDRIVKHAERELG